jgi:hypothetical protein
VHRAISAGVLRQVLLVIALGVVEGRQAGQRRDVRGDPPVSRRGQALAIRFGRRAHEIGLLRAEGENRRTVLGAAVVALTHALGRIVVLPEVPEDARVVDHRGIEYDEHGFGMSRPSAAHLFVGGVGRVSADVACRRGVDAVEFPEALFRAPETAHRDDRELKPFGKRRVDRVTVDVVGIRHVERLRPAGQGSVGCDHDGFGEAQTPH